MVRRGRVPEVVQSSAMDCGPAALAAFLQGHGVPASYPRLREVCQTGVDGTSIDVLESTCCELGLAAEQVVVPAEFVLADAARNIPSIVVVVLPDGFTHFVVAWRTSRGRVVVMDPAVGRRVVRSEQFIDELFEFPLRVPVGDWAEWAVTDDFVGPCRARLGALGLHPSAVDALAAAAVAGGALGLATLDAAIRAAERLVGDGRVRRGGDVAAVVEAAMGDRSLIPRDCWRITSDGSGEVEMRGAVLVRVVDPSMVEPPGLVPDELRPVVEDRPPRLVAQVLTLAGVRAAVAVAVVIAIGGVLRSGEAWLVRDASSGDAISGGVLWTLVGLVGVLAVLETVGRAITVALGRRVDVALRREVLDRLPRMGDAYFRSRPASDLADRAHSVHRVRTVADVAGVAVRAAGELVGVLVGLVVAFPAGWPVAVALVAVAVAAPVVAVRVIGEVDMRARTHAGALSQFHLDGLVGGAALRAHRGHGAVRHVHDTLLGAWWTTARSLVSRVTAVATVTESATTVLAVLLVVWAAAADGGLVVLLVAFWAFTVPALSAELVVVARTWPSARSTLLRLVEPLTTPLEPTAPQVAVPQAHGGGVSVRLVGVTVTAGGHVVLDDVSVAIPAGQHVAVVGRSGSGKSSLAAVLLGVLRPETGVLFADEVPVTDDLLATWRRHLAWVDPDVRVWNAPLVDNVAYGTTLDLTATGLAAATIDAGLGPVATQVGLAPLGDAGGRLSGGQRQRVRLARALARPDPALVVLDEAFRGLERTERDRLLAVARHRWSTATLVAVTHDTAASRSFDRVLVIDDGRIIEDGPPETLARQPGTAYRALLDAEAHLDGLWSHWRHLHLADGRLTQVPAR